MALTLAATVSLSGCGASQPKPGTVLDEAMRAKRTASSFPAADEDYFHDMDGALPLTKDQSEGRNMWIVWSGGNDRQWAALAKLLGIDDERFATNGQRVGLWVELIETLEAALSAESAETWLGRLAELGIPAGKVRTLDDVYSWDQTRSQGLVIEVEHPTLGPVELPGPPLRFDDNTYAGWASWLAPAEGAAGARVADLSAAQSLWNGIEAESRDRGYRSRCSGSRRLRRERA